MDPLDQFLRLSAAALLGSLVGLERHRSDKAAGMRTHMLVSLGSAVFMIVSAYGFDSILGKRGTSFDPSRIASQVVSGIGFLGAGTILRRNDTVLGLTTAASVWSVAAIGLASGGGLYLTAILATIFILVILTLMKPLEESMARTRHVLTLSVAQGAASPLPQIELVIRQAQLEIKHIQFHQGDKIGESQLTLTINRDARLKVIPILDQLRSIPGVKDMNYETGPST